MHWSVNLVDFSHWVWQVAASHCRYQVCSQNSESQRRSYALMLCLKRLAFDDDGSWNCLRIKIVSTFVAVLLNSYKEDIYTCLIHSIDVFTRCVWNERIRANRICTKFLLNGFRLNLVLEVLLNLTDFRKESCYVKRLRGILCKVWILLRSATFDCNVFRLVTIQTKQPFVWQCGVTVTLSHFLQNRYFGVRLGSCVASSYSRKSSATRIASNCHVTIAVSGITDVVGPCVSASLYAEGIAIWYAFR
jgi:hypothetical protein